MDLSDQNKKKESFVDKSIDFLFSKDGRKWLVLILILGFVLRFIAASNIPPVADEMVHGSHAIGVSALKPLSTMTQGPIWFYLTDYAYRIFGVHLITARFLSFVFGSLSIILTYLIGSLVLNKKAGLVAAFLLAVSPFHITWTAAYHDQAMMFFVLMASYLFVKDYKEKKQISIFASVFLAMAVLIKIITGVFVIVFGAFMLGILIKDYRNDKKMFKRNFKRALVFGAIIVVSLTPLVAYDYFLYKEKGIVDLVFAQFLRINAEFYTGPGLAHGEGFVINKLPKNLYSVFTVYFLKEDPILLFMSIFGIVLLARKWKEIDFGKGFLLATFFFVLLFIASAIVLQTHYTSFIPLMALFGAGFFTYSSDWLKKYGKEKYIAYGAIILIIAFNIYSIGGALTSQSAIEGVREYVSSIDQNTLVLADSRIYTSTMAWMLNDKNYLDSSYFGEIMQISNAEGAQRAPVKTAFVECLQDDCGWGTIAGQPELNRSVEELIGSFANVSQKTTDISGGGSVKDVRGTEIADEPYFRIYEATLSLDPRVLESVKQTHNNFFYHIPRNEYASQSFDYYNVNGFLDNLINTLAYIVLYAFMIGAVLSGIYVFYLLYKN